MSDAHTLSPPPNKPRNFLSPAPTWKSLQKAVASNKKTSTPSPLDRICGGLKERAQQLGLTPRRDEYLLNQSCPSIVKEKAPDRPSMGDVRKCNLNKFNGDSLHSYNFSPSQSKEVFLRSPEGCRALNSSWVFSSYVAGGCPAHFVPVRNPNKAVITIDAKTTEILVANKMACSLLCVKSSEIGGKKLCEFFVSKKEQYSLSESELKDSGELVFISGKVMEIVTSDQRVIPVSVWARHLENEEEPRCLVVMEQVDRTVGSVNFDQKGKIVDCDKNFASIHGFSTSKDVEGQSILNLIPSLILPLPTESQAIPKAIRKQRATGRTKDGTTFPLSIHIRLQSSCEGLHSSQQQQQVFESGDKVSCVDMNVVYCGTVWVFANVSGLITVLPDGTIHSCNTNFSLILFGYTQNQLVGKNISLLIPSFYDDLEFLDTDSMPLPPLDDEEDDSNARCGYRSDSRNSSVMDLPRPVNPLGKHIDLMVEDAIEGIEKLNFSPSPLGNCSLRTDSSSSFRDNIPSIPRSESLNLCYPEQTSSSAKMLTSGRESPDSSLCVESSRQLSVSESQDTLHSCTNSITESDINANVLDVNDHTQSPQLHMPRKASICDMSSSFSSSYTNGDSSGEDEGHDEPKWRSNCSPGRHQANCNYAADSRSPNCDIAQVPAVSTPLDNFHVDHGAVPVSNVSEESVHSIPEGNYFGVGRHQDGSDLAIIYQIRKVMLEDGTFLYCLWVTRDPEEYGENHKSFRNLTLASSHTSSLSRTVESSAHSALHDSYSSQFSDSSSIDMSDFGLTTGDYCENYTNLSRVGKGAFGCVMKAYRNSDGLLVITKFIKKSKVYKELWVHNNALNQRVPLEVSLLLTISHPNIVKVLDVFENDDYIQMVMEKHGAGIDLFEFIDRGPKMDEQLASYIFRQIVSAISYLHSLSIIHRDIKDENIIIDEKFHVKLIDFGSAVFMGNELFSTFCGTMEYCSPEVIQGEKYRGPELEMWALGVTLYTLVFGENPFVDVEETIHAEIFPPSTVSHNLMSLIRHLLDPDPTTRCVLSEVQDHPWTNLPVEVEKYKFEEVVNASSEELNPPKYHSAILDQDSVLGNGCIAQPELSMSTDNLTSSESSLRNHLLMESDVESLI